MVRKGKEKAKEKEKPAEAEDFLGRRKAKVTLPKNNKMLGTHFPRPVPEESHHVKNYHVRRMMPPDGGGLDTPSMPDLFEPEEEEAEKPPPAPPPPAVPVGSEALKCGLLCHSFTCFSFLSMNA